MRAPYSDFGLNRWLGIIVSLYKARQVIQGRFGTTLIVFNRYFPRNALVTKRDSCTASFFFECNGELHLTRHRGVVTHEGTSEHDGFLGPHFHKNQVK